MKKQTPEIITCLGALFTMEYYKEHRHHLEEVSDREYDDAVTTLVDASDDVWALLSEVIEEEPDRYVSGSKSNYREYCKGIRMLRDLA